MGFLEKAARKKVETVKRQKFVKDLQKCVLCCTLWIKRIETQEVEQRAQWSSPTLAAYCALYSISCVPYSLSTGTTSYRLILNFFVDISDLVLKFRPPKYVVAEGRPSSPAFAQTLAALFAKGLIRDISPSLYLRISRADYGAEESREGKSHTGFTK